MDLFETCSAGKLLQSEIWMFPNTKEAYQLLASAD